MFTTAINKIEVIKLISIHTGPSLSIEYMLYMVQ
jgi:hypothetical protein